MGNSKNLKNLFMIVILAVAVLSIGMHRAQVTRSPSVSDISFAELKHIAPITSNHVPAASEQPEQFGLDSVEVAGANIERAEGFSELYIEPDTKCGEVPCLTVSKGSDGTQDKTSPNTKRIIR